MELKQLDAGQRDELMSLIKRSGFAIVCSQGTDGHPNAKAMFCQEYDGLKTFYFSTNVSSRRTGDFKENPKACIYVFDPASFQGIMLVGNMTVRTDRALRERLWRDGCEIYYPTGIDDPDYCVLQFEVLYGNYYHGLSNFDFAV
jgi:general stress protein 26